MLYAPVMKHDDIPRSVPPGWLDALSKSDADLAAGRVVPAAVVRAELRASIARLEAAERADTGEVQPALGHSAALGEP